MKDSIYDLLFEQDDSARNVESDSSPTPRLSNDSVDDQIDSFLLFYEKRSIKSAETLDESLKNLSLRFLFEQEEELPDEEPPPEEPPAEETGDEGGEAAEPAVGADTDESDPTGSEEISDDIEPAPIKSPPIDIDQFTKSVARLALNPEDLLDLKTVIINRAKNYLIENYGEKHAEKYKEILETQFNFDLEVFERETSSEDVFGLGANPAGAGISGG